MWPPLYPGQGHLSSLDTLAVPKVEFGAVLVLFFFNPCSGKGGGGGGGGGRDFVAKFGS